MKDLDKKILLQLLKDAEQTTIDIANKVGASRQTVSKKIKKFKEEKIIKGFSATVDPKKLDLGVKAYIFLQENPHEDFREENESFISKFPQITKFFRLFGRYSSLLEVRTENRENLTSIIKKIHELEGVKETETFIVHSTVKNEPDDPIKEFLEGRN